MTLWELADKQPILALFAIVCGSGVLALAIFAFSASSSGEKKKDDDDPPGGAGGGAEQPS